MDKTVGAQVNPVDRIGNPIDDLREYIIVNSKCLVCAVCNCADLERLINSKIYYNYSQITPHKPQRKETLS